jgi:hypothetical protein
MDEHRSVVVMGMSASPSEKFAAQGMAAYLEKITGQRIAIVDDGDVPDDRTILAVGRSTLTASVDTSGPGCKQWSPGAQRILAAYGAAGYPV